MNANPVLIVDLALAVIFFFLLNWIGRRTVSLGYLQFSVFARQDEAPAFNFILRTASPTIYIIVVSAIMYALHRDSYVLGIWRVVPYYFGFRALVNVAFGRVKLINWRAFVAQASVGIGLAYFLYVKLILTKQYILPDVGTLANELWLIIILFLYTVLNRVQTSSEGTRRRKRRYLIEQYARFKDQFGTLISHESIPEDVRYLAYAIMIYENFGRPAIVRRVEHLLPRLALTRGIMQVRSRNRITDAESVTLAVRKLSEDFTASRAEALIENEAWVRQVGVAQADKFIAGNAVRKTIVLYNKDQDYVGEVQMLIEELRRLDKEGSAAAR